MPSVYILTNINHSVLYVGVTRNLTKRIWQHKTNSIFGFTAKYNVHKLVYIEMHSSFDQAIKREKQLKRWKRSWKEELISQQNPHWADLYELTY